MGITVAATNDLTGAVFRGTLAASEAAKEALTCALAPCLAASTVGLPMEPPIASCKSPRLSPFDCLYSRQPPEVCQLPGMLTALVTCGCKQPLDFMGHTYEGARSCLSTEARTAWRLSQVHAGS